MHIHKHNLTTTQYKKMFPNSTFVSNKIYQNLLQHRFSMKGQTKENPIVAKQWKTRRKHEPNNESCKKSWETRHKLYGK